MRASALARDLTPNFGTMPTAFLKSAPPQDSWWVGLSREEFGPRAAQEANRMIGSQGAKWVDGLHVTNLCDWGAEMRITSSVKALR